MLFSLKIRNFFVAMGAALDEDQAQLALSEIIHNLENNTSKSLVPKNTLDVSFQRPS